MIALEKRIKAKAPILRGAIARTKVVAASTNPRDGGSVSITGTSPIRGVRGTKGLTGVM